MGQIWSEANKLAKWLEVELAAVEALAECGQVPKAAAAQLRARARVPTPERVQEIERQVRHDIIAFTMAVAEGLGEEARYLHYALTSSDVLDTAQALLLREANVQIGEGLERLLAVLKKRAQEFKHTPMVGRTHGVHAEPTTFGLKLAAWYNEMNRNRERFERAAQELAVGKVSGAVGTFAHMSPAVEERVCQCLGLEPAAVSSQIIQRDRHAHYLGTLAVMAASLEKFALEVRHLQRTEVREAEEEFGSGQRGSSAMPHKRNPIVAEQICGLARVVRANAQAALENVPLWHERDISHSSAERVILPDSTILADYLLEKTATLIETLRVYPERMRENLDLTRGLIFSEAILLALVRKDVPREEGYAWVQEAARKVWEGKQDFRQAVLADRRITEKLTAQDMDAAFDLSHQLRYVEDIFRRVFGE